MLTCQSFAVLPKVADTDLTPARFLFLLVFVQEMSAP